VPDHHDGFLASIFFQKLTELREPSFGAQPGVNLQFAFVANLVAYQGRGLRAALQRAGNNCIDLNIKHSQSPPDVPALFDTLFVKGASLVLFRIGNVLACTGVA